MAKARTAAQKASQRKASLASAAKRKRQTPTQMRAAVYRKVVRAGGSHSGDVVAQYRSLLLDYGSNKAIHSFESMTPAGRRKYAAAFYDKDHS